MDTDHALLNAARMMDKSALVRIFELYSRALYKYALRLCGDPMLADQIVGDVFAKLLDQLSSGNGPTAHLRSYLYETPTDSGAVLYISDGTEIIPLYSNRPRSRTRARP